MGILHPVRGCLMADDLEIVLSAMDYAAVGVAVVAAMVIGWLWFGPLFGRVWAREVGMPMTERPPPKVFLRALLLNLIGVFLIAYVLLHTVLAWQPKVWGDHLGVAATNSPPYFYGGMAAAFTWLGFFVPVSLGRVAWEKRSWKWFGIDVGYYFVLLQAMGMILAYMS